MEMIESAGIMPSGKYDLREMLDMTYPVCKRDMKIPNQTLNPHDMDRHFAGVLSYLHLALNLSLGLLCAIPQLVRKKSMKDGSAYQTG